MTWDSRSRQAPRILISVIAHEHLSTPLPEPASPAPTPDK